MSAETSRPSTGADWSQPAASSARTQSATEALKDQVGEALDRGKAGISESAKAAGENLSEDLAKLREDMARMQQTLSKFAASAGGEAYRTAQNVGAAVASQVGEVASEVASGAKEQAKTFASEIEGMARRNPLGTIAATLLVGVVIGMMSRGRG
jgi:ElaB/YqjD/DUF883 family membrane-anchored ribosome-binding protein